MSEGFRLGLLGCGNRTRALLNALRWDGFYRVEAAYDLNPEAVKSLTEFYGGTPCATLTELKEAKNVDAFLISLSPLAHADALREMIPLGKPVFVEKPVAFTGKETRELKDLADRYHVPVQVGFMRRYLPLSLEMLSYINNNPTGRIFSTDCEWVHHGAVAMHYNAYHRPDNFRTKVSQIPFHCCHMLDVMLLMNGPVKSVTSHYRKEINLSYPSPDDVLSTLEFSNGSFGRFHYSSVVYYNNANYRFNCENYSIILDLLETGLKIYRKPRFRTSEVGPDPEHTDEKFESFYESMCKPKVIHDNIDHLLIANENIMYDFVKMVRDGVPPKADLAAAVRVQGLAEAVEMSGKRKRTILLDEDGVPLAE